MTKRLADQLGFDTIFRFVRSAPMRLEEGDALSKEHPLIAIYLYGYAAEMVLKAAYFKNVGYSAITEIDRGDIKRAEGVARLNGLMSARSHDILGWARLLVSDKQNLHMPAYGATMSNKIVASASTVYDNWRPQMRYRNTLPSPAIVSAVRDAVDWLLKNYPRM